MLNSTKNIGQKRDRSKVEESAKDSSPEVQKKMRKQKSTEKRDIFERSNARHSNLSNTSHLDLFSFSAPLEQICLPINSQKGKTSALLSKTSQRSFEHAVPYIIAYHEDASSIIVFDVDKHVNLIYRNQSQEQKLDLENGAWKKNYSNALFFAFLDERSSAIPLGSLKDLKDIGISDEHLLGALLSPIGETKKSQVLYLFLSEEGLIDKRFKSYERSIRKSLGRQEIKWQKEELAIDFAGSSSSVLLKKLLDQKVDPNAFSTLFGVHAINVAKKRDRDENIQLLLQYGANPDAKEQDPDC